MVIYFDKFDKIDDKKYTLLYSFLPPSRKQKVDKTKDEQSKKIQIVEYYLVKKHLGISSQKDFLYNKYGKPYILGEKHFSISHTKTALVIAISDNEIGIDIQEISNVSERLIQKVLNESEMQQVQNSICPSEEFTKLWTKKESYVKYYGTSIFYKTRDILNFASDVTFHTIKKNNQIITTCTKKVEKNRKFLK